MLKVRSQLGPALKYQAMFGASRTVGHFDHGASDLAGPPTQADVLSGDTQQTRRAKLIGGPLPAFQFEIDPVTGGIRGVASEDR